MTGRTARRALVCVAALVVSGCTQRQGPPPQLVVTTTTEPGVTTTTLPGGPPPLPPRTLDEIEGDLEDAVAAGDFCALVDALDDAAPDTDDGQVVIATYEALATAVKQAASFVPSQLSESWTIVVAGIDDGVVAARRVGGDVDDPALRAPFVDGQFESAMTAVETWSDSNCGS